MSARAIVVSDVHLGAAPERVERDFIRFLRSWPDAAETLLINGDLFDFWFEYRSVIPAGYFHVLRALADLRDRGVRLVLVGGNHDAWGGPFLAREVGLEPVDGPLEIELGGRRTLVAHGDGLGSGDLGYKVLKRAIRSPLSRTLMRWVHPDLAQRIADRVSRTSSRSERDRARAIRRARILREHAEGILSHRTDLDAVIFGHCHIPELVEVREGRHYINSGDWIDHRTVTIIGPDEIEQREWSDPSALGLDPNDRARSPAAGRVERGGDQRS